MLRNVKVKLAPNEEFYFGLSGDYIRVKQSADELEFRDATDHLNNVFSMVEGDDAHFDGEFRNLAVRNLGATENEVILIIGRGARITKAANISMSGGGVSSLVDVGNFPTGFNVNNFALSDVDLSKNGAAFIGIGNSPAVASQLSHTQLFNPVGSGKRVIVERVISASGNASYLKLNSLNASIGGVVQTTFDNKRFGGVAPVAEIRVASNAAALGVNIGFNSAAAANLFGGEFGFKKPIILNEGYGVVIVGTTVNIGLNATFEWFEETI